MHIWKTIVPKVVPQCWSLPLSLQRRQTQTKQHWGTIFRKMTDVWFNVCSLPRVCPAAASHTFLSFFFFSRFLGRGVFCAISLGSAFVLYVGCLHSVPIREDFFSHCARTCWPDLRSMVASVFWGSGQFGQILEVSYVRGGWPRYSVRQAKTWKTGSLLARAGGGGPQK